MTKIISDIQTKTGIDKLVEVELEYAFFDVESGESLKGHFTGHGSDRSDKALYKAITGAIKYILTTTFLIPTGDDPEEEKQKKEEVKSVIID
jgi:hypothetical protein